MTVDLCGLAPALRAHAKARYLTVSQAARLAVAAALEPASPDPQVQPERDPDSAADQPVKLTIRLRRGIAARLTERARDCGLSHGAYLTTLVDAAPAPPLAMVKALSASTDQLAVVSADMNEVIRLLRRDTSPSQEVLGEVLRSIVDGTRRHLDLASRVVAELRPARTYPRRPPGNRAAGKRISQ
jgi:hypothetical protein